MHASKVQSSCLAAAAILSLQAAAHGQMVQAVYTIVGSDPTGPKSLVPGTLGTDSGIRFSNFSRLFRSPSTKKWCTVGTMSGQTGATDQVFVIGSGPTGVVAIREGNVVPTSPPGTEVLGFGLAAPRMNDSDQWAIAFPAGTITSTTNSRLLTWDGSAFHMIRIGDAVTAFPGATYNGTFNGTNIANSGATAFLAGMTGGSSAGNAILSDSGATALISPSVDSPSGQMTATPAQWNTFVTDKFWQDASAAHYIISGTVGIDANTNAVAVVDGVVKVQKGFPVPSTTFTANVSTINDVWMESNADWFVRGSNADGQFWLLRNGAVIAASGTPITPGATELWATSTPANAFRDVKGDNRGNYIISGRTNNADATKIDVLVLNGTRILARQSDPVDLNGDGVANDDMFIGVMQSDRSTFNNDGYYYFGPRVKNGAGTSASGSNLLRVRVFQLTCNADFNADGDIGTDADIEAFFACLAGSCCQTCGTADFNGDGDIGTDADIESFFRVLGGGSC